MRVKFQNSSKGWVIIDNITQIEHSIVENKESLVLFQNMCNHDEYIAQDVFDERKIAHLVLQIKDADDVSYVLAYTPIFITNDLGQTIDRI